MKIYTPESYGAVGDGTTNDCAAIQQAIDAAAENGGGTVVLESGKTYYSDSIQLKKQVQLHFQDGLPKSFQEFSISCADIFSVCGDRLYVLLSSCGDPAFPSRLQQEMRPLMFSVMGFSEEEPHLDYLIAFGFSAITSIIGHWYENGKDMEFEELFQMMQTLVATGGLGYTKKELFTL